MPEIFDIIKQNKETILILTVFVLLLFVLWNVYLHYNLLKIRKKTRIFFENEEARNLEEIIYEQIKRTNETNAKIKKLAEDNDRIRKDLSQCIQKVGVVRFNPYGDVGGNQSFAIALLDNSLNGIVILSLYSRDNVRIYSKSIKEGRSEYTLSKEEKQAISLAKGE